MASLSFIAAVSNALTVRAVPDGLQRPLDRGRWWTSLVKEPFTGAWQRNISESRESIVRFGAIYSAVTLISSDIAKLRVKLVERDADRIWSEVEVPAFSPVLRKPNKWQNRVKFYQQWVISKLLHGNTYVLKERDLRGVVVAMYILDPTRVKPLVAPNGDVYYECKKDNLSGLEDELVILPASEIIHDVHAPLFHPLVGLSPIMACGLAATHGLTIQENSQRFFRNNSQPGGILVAPGPIDEAVALRIKEAWEANMGGENAGRVAVVGDGMKYETMTVSASDAQLMDQLKWDEKNVCTAFHVPPYMIGVGEAPKYDNIQALQQQYYMQCLQELIECIEICLDEGLGLTEHQGHTYGTEFDLDDLLRMDSATAIRVATDGLKGVFTTNEARRRFDLKKVKGGDEVYRQEQDHALSALAARDASDDPFGKKLAPAATPAASDAGANDNSAPADVAAAKQVAHWKLKSLLAV